MGPGWIPSGMVTRQIADVLTKGGKDNEGIFEVLQRKHGHTFGKKPAPALPPIQPGRPASGASQGGQMMQSRSSPALANSASVFQVPAERTDWADKANIRLVRRQF